MIIENKSKVHNSQNKSIVSQVKSCDANSSSSSKIAKLTHAVNQQTSVVTTTMTAILKQFQATPPPASIKAVEEIYVTCGGAHSYYQFLVVDGNTFLEFWDNMQGYVSAAVVNYNQDLFATNRLSGNPTFSSHSDLTSPEVKDDIFDPEGDIVLIKKLLNIVSTKELPPPHNINPSSGSTTSSSSHHLLEEFADELALITFSPGNDDLLFDIKSNLREIKYLLNHDPTKEMDSILEDTIDESNLANPNDNIFDTIPEMFTDEHALYYSSPSLYNEYYDDLDEFESDTVDAYNDPFDSKGEKIKESKLLIDELDLPRSFDFLPSPEYDSFLFEEFFEVDALPSTNN
nr:hypothetical protein [Tanacetum cinerariifolium]